MEKVLKFLFPSIYAIIDLMEDTSTDIVSKEGWRVLNDPVRLKQVLKDNNIDY